MGMVWLTHDAARGQFLRRGDARARHVRAYGRERRGPARGCNSRPSRLGVLSIVVELPTTQCCVGQVR